MKNQALFSSKDNNKKLKCRLLQFLFGALRVNDALCISVINVTLPDEKQNYIHRIGRVGRAERFAFIH